MQTFLRTIIPKTLFKAQKRAFGMIDDYSAKQQRKQFDEFLNMMKTKEQFTYSEYRMMVDDNVKSMEKGFIRKIFSSQDESKEELIEARKILHAMLPNELEDHKFLEMKNIQEEIATVVQVPVERVRKVTQTYVQHKLMHSWIQSLIKNDRPLPLNMNEMMVRFRAEFKMTYDGKKEIIYKREMEKENATKRQVQERIEKKRSVTRLKRLKYRV